MDWQFAALEKEKNICGINISVLELNVSGCSNEQEKGQLEVVAILRIFTSCLSILGALSIIGSALYRKTFCNPKVHPLFVLSIADLMLSILWICGSVIWLKGGFQKGHWRVRCFSINLMTVILQCVAMNLTLLYALLAYSSIKQKDFSGVYMVQQRTDSIHVWHPLCSFTAYLIAWMLPVFIIMIPFGIMSSYYGLVRLANTCSCWCMPYLGNVIPRPHLKIPNNKDKYLEHLHNFVAFYGATISVNFLFVLVCMIIIYYKVFKRIRRMGKTQEQNETTPLYGATQAMILEGQKDARRRVLLFIAVFFVSGSVTLTFAIREINNYYNHNHGQHHGIYRLYIMLVIEALFVPIQGFLNAAVYGWTRGDFLNVMSSRKVYSRPNHFSLSYENEEETVVEDDGEEDGERWQGESQRMGNSILFLSMEQEGGSSPISRRQGASNAITPGSPGVLLGGGSTD